MEGNLNAQYKRFLEDQIQRLEQEIESFKRRHNIKEELIAPRIPVEPNSSQFTTKLPNALVGKIKSAISNKIIPNFYAVKEPLWAWINDIEAKNGELPYFNHTDKLDSWTNNRADKNHRFVAKSTTVLKNFYKQIKNLQSEFDKLV